VQKLFWRILDTLYLLAWRLPLFLANRHAIFNTLTVTITSDLSDYLDPPRYLGARKRPRSLADIIEALNRAARDYRVRVVIVRIKSVGSLATADELRSALLRFREKGKKVIAFFETAGTAEYYLACAADEIVMPATGALMLNGVRAEVTFYREAFDKIGVQPDFEAIGEFKNFGNSFTENGFTKHHRQATESLVDEIFNTLVETTAQSRNFTPAETKRKINRGPFNGEQAHKAALVDVLAYDDELPVRLKENGVAKPKTIKLLDYLARINRERSLEDAWREYPAIAVVTLNGTIKQGRSLYQQNSEGAIGCDTTAKIFREIKKDDELKGVIVRVNSRGGSAIASDIIWRQIARVAKKKPVVISFSDFAASGGYYLAMAGSEIVCNPHTLTGSIGVLTGKFALGELYDKLGFSVETVERGTNSGIYSALRPFTDKERKKIRQDLKSFYDTFLDRVAEGRKTTKKEIDKVARGRVWTGRQALENKLVDRMGGFHETFELLCEKLGLPPDQELAIAVYPRFPRLMMPASGLSGLARMTGGSFELTEEISALQWLKKETILAWEPRHIRFK
jgi:protease IV